MKCEKHPEREAVGYCGDCTTFGCDLCLSLATDGKRYCRECMEREGRIKAEDEEIEEQVSEGPKAPPAEKIAIQKLVAHYANGKIMKGVAYKLEEKLPGFYMIPRGERKGAEEIYIKFSELKAVFLVRDFDGGPSLGEVEKEFIPEGHEIVVYFKDGEVLEGFALGEYSPESDRFHVIPKDSSGNNISVLVERAAIEKVELGKVFRAKEYVRMSDTPVKRMILCYYWDNLGKTTTIKKIAEALERTERIVERDIDVFLGAGFMRRTGKGKDTEIVFVKPQDKDTRQLLAERVEEAKKYLPKK